MSSKTSRNTYKATETNELVYLVVYLPSLVILDLMTTQLNLN